MAIVNLLHVNMMTFFKLTWEMLVAQSCPALCNPVDCSLPGSSVHGIVQARMLAWVAIPFSRGFSQPRDRTLVSCIAGKFFTVWVTRKALYYCYYYYYFWPRSMWNLSSLTTDWTHVPCTQSAESQPLDHQGSWHGRQLLNRRITLSRTN